MVAFKQGHGRTNRYKITNFSQDCWGNRARAIVAPAPFHFTQINTKIQKKEHNQSPGLDVRQCPLGPPRVRSGPVRRCLGLVWLPALVWLPCRLGGWRHVGPLPRRTITGGT